MQLIGRRNEGPGLVKTLALGPTAGCQDRLATIVPPAHSALLHALRNEGLTRGFDRARADGQALLLHLGVPHALAMPPKVLERAGNRLRARVLTADADGSNGYRSRQWKLGLQELADETGLHIRVSHLPPATSKWNKIEHRLFSHISMNWRGKLLTSHEVIVSLIAGTSTRTGLRVKARLDRRRYRTGLQVPERVFKQLQIEPDEFPSGLATIHPVIGSFRTGPY